MALNVFVAKKDSTYGVFEAESTIEMIYALSKMGMRDIQGFSVALTTDQPNPTKHFSNIEWKK